MPKTLIFERTVQVGQERVSLRLFRARAGLLLERALGQQDGRMLVQVLGLPTLKAMDQLEEFFEADEHINSLAVAYNEVLRRARTELMELIPDSGRTKT
jgi:hypothetical protein